jgi:hypothetical protein
MSLRRVGSESASLPHPYAAGTLRRWPRRHPQARYRPHGRHLRGESPTNFVGADSAKYVEDNPVAKRHIELVFEAAQSEWAKEFCENERKSSRC